MTRIIRLYIEQNLSLNRLITLNTTQIHYLLNVLRLDNESNIIVFNEKDGEYLSVLNIINKRNVQLKIQEFIKLAPKEEKILFCFAPIKKIRLDYMMQKVVEMGATEIQPLKTEYTQNSKLNYDKLEANIIEAAEQCGRITKPKLHKICCLLNFVNNLTNDNLLIFCDEKANSTQNLNQVELQEKAIALLIGPEGGFSPLERKILIEHKSVKSITLGQNILRADTAAVAALAIIKQKMLLS